MLQVIALDGTVIHVTCTQKGFYVNGSGRGTFDPRPIAGNACHSHELAVCLLARNQSFAKVRNVWFISFRFLTLFLLPSCHVYLPLIG